ncbi:hypothetical protein WJX77_007260 [Trebouxia sp. C0004]
MQGLSSGQVREENAQHQVDGIASGVPGSRTFYKRTLPCPPAVAFSSSEGKAMFADALLNGTLQGFFKLIEQFRTQDEPAFCGLASLAMVLNALAVDPKRAWKGPWRWFHEQMLDCCQPLSTVIETGINLDQAACLARCNGAMAELVRCDSLSEEDFRATVQEICVSDQQHVIVSYSRKQFLQTGDGHFSPIGGFHARKDMVLILDTARFKYPPHWVPLAQLYQAMAAVDPTTGKARGFIRLAANPKLESVMFTMKRPTRAWQQVRAFMDTTLPDILTSHQQQTSSSGCPLPQPHHLDITSATIIDHHVSLSSASAGSPAVRLLRSVLNALPKEEILEILVVRSSPTDCCSAAAPACISPAAAASFLNELHSTEIYRVVQQRLQESTDALQTDVCSTSDSHSGRAAIPRPQAASDTTGNGQNKGSHKSSSHKKSLAIRSAAVDADADSLGSMTGSMSQHVKQLHGVEALCMFLLITDSVWSLVKDVEVQVGVLQMMDMSTYALVASEVAYLAAQWNELHALQMLESQGSNLTCVEHLDN